MLTTIRTGELLTKDGRDARPALPPSAAGRPGREHVVEVAS
jgi:hypothetical protein